MFGDPLTGPFVQPGEYRVTLSQRVGGVVTDLSAPAAFKVVADPQSGLTTADCTARWQFDEKLQALRRDIGGSIEQASVATTRVKAVTKALDATPAAPRALHDRVRALERQLDGILVALRGDRTLGSRSGPQPIAISERVTTISGELRSTLGRPTQTHEEPYQIALDLFGPRRSRLRQAIDVDLPAIERDLERPGAPNVARD